VDGVGYRIHIYFSFNNFSIPFFFFQYIFSKYIFPEREILDSVGSRQLYVEISRDDSRRTRGRMHRKCVAGMEGMKDTAGTHLPPHIWL
jgi:hypothetical protein